MKPSGRDRQQPRKTVAMTMADVLELPDADRDLVSWLMRHGPVGFAQARNAFPEDDMALRTRLDTLAGAGFVEIGEQDGDVRYSVRVTARATRRAASADIWKALGE